MKYLVCLGHEGFRLRTDVRPGTTLSTVKVVKEYRTLATAKQLSAERYFELLPASASLPNHSHRHKRGRRLCNRRGLEQSAGIVTARACFGT